MYCSDGTAIELTTGMVLAVGELLRPDRINFVAVTVLYKRQKLRSQEDLQTRLSPLSSQRKAWQTS